MSPYSFIRRIKSYKLENKKIAMATCYDATFAKLIDESSIEMILVGDSLGMVIKGEETTLNVSLDEVVYHTKAVARGAKKTHIVADMPFLSYQGSKSKAVKHAGKLMQAGAHAVKLEGGKSLGPLVKKLTESGIPVVGHIGLTPQSIATMGGYVIQGKTEVAHQQLVEDAEVLQSAGAFCLVLEGMKSEVSAHITDFLTIPTIGIGAGKNCGGQVLVLHDLLGLNAEFKPKFVRNFSNGASWVKQALESFSSEIQAGSFPSNKESF